MKSGLKYYKTKKQINDEKKRIANELKFLNDSLVGIKSGLKLLKSREIRT